MAAACRPLPDGVDALVARLVLAEMAERSLDLQYYIWHKDLTGRLLADALLRAADRGVRVRVLVDDVGTKSNDDTLLSLDAHPNIEVRLFNPVVSRARMSAGTSGPRPLPITREHQLENSMKQPLAILGAALLVAVSLPAPAQQPQAKAAAVVASAPGTGTVAAAVSISASVESIDKAQRQITLKGPKGNMKTMTVGPDARNFDQIKVGDMVVVRYVESLTLTLKKDGKELPSKGETAGAARSKAGEKPAGIVAQQVEVTADVIAVDAKTRTLTLKGPKQTVELKVPSAEQFKMVKVGDKIQAVYTEAVALSVEAAPAKK